MRPALEFQDVSVSYLGRPALRGITFAVEPGQMVGIIGPNGAGKSTLLKAAVGLLPLDSGRVTLLGMPVAAGRRRVAYVPQRGEVDWDFPVLVRDVVLMGRYRHAGWFRRPGPADRIAAEAALAQVGMLEYAHRQVGRLSGGQQQRVFLARALAQDADLFLLDEPFAGVDAATEQIIAGILSDLARSGRTVVVVHHDLSQAARRFDTLVLLNRELVAVGPAAAVLTPENLSRTYAGRLAVLPAGDGTMVVNG